MAFVSLVSAPVLQLVSILLILVTLLSPVPYHASSIALIYVSPTAGTLGHTSSANTTTLGHTLPLARSSASTSSAPPPLTATRRPDSFSMARSLHGLPEPTAPPGRSKAPQSSAASMQPPPDPSSGHPFPTSSTEFPAVPMQKRDDPQDTASVPRTKVRYTVGLLGSCFVNAQGASHCTPSSMHPTFNNTWLASTPGLGLKTRGMLTTLHAEPALILFCLLMVAATSVLQVRRVHVEACKASCSQPTPRLLLLLRIAAYAQDAAAIALFAIMIFLRVRVARANDAFNAANGAHALGPSAFTEPGMVPTPLVLHAGTGTAFSCVCVASVLLYGLAHWERRRLRGEMPRAANDEEAGASRKWSRFWHAPLAETLHPVSRPITVSAPMPVYTPDHTPSRSAAWRASERRRSPVHPCPRLTHGPPP